MASLRVLLLMLCVIAAAHVPAATAEFNPALATLAANPEHDGLLATGKALTGDVREDANVIIANRALAAEGGESPHTRAVRVLAEEDFLSPGEAEGAALAVEEYRRSLKKNKKGKKGKKEKKGKGKKGKQGKKGKKAKKALKAKAKKLRKQAKALIAKAKALEKKAK